MKEYKKLSYSKYTKVLVPAKSYNYSSDSRLLIPYTMGAKIGFINNHGNIVVNPIYSMYYGECYESDDLIRVALIDSYGFPRSGGNVATYHRYLYGLIDCNGKIVQPTEYFSIRPAIGNKKLFTVQRKDYMWGVITADGTEIVPFGKYDWIDGFDGGYARVIGKEKNWGIINEKGEEVLPVEYNYIWNFYDKNRNETKIEKDGVSSKFFFNKREDIRSKRIDNDYDYNDYGSHYGEYAGNYAQDVAGYSGDVIDDAFDGDPDAYWNID